LIEPSRRCRSAGFDLPFRCRPLGHDLLLAHVRLVELDGAHGHDVLEALNLAEYLVVLRRDAVDGLDPVQEIVEAPRAEDDRERRVLLVGRVDRA